MKVTCIGRPMQLECFQVIKARDYSADEKKKDRRPTAGERKRGRERREQRYTRYFERRGLLDN